MMFKTLGFVVVFALVLVGCASDNEEVPLSFLVLHTGSYDGKTLILEGQVKGLDDPEHYWLEDNHHNRVGLSPDKAVKGYRDQSVRVTGRFEASSDKGRQLRVREIEVLE